MNDVLLIFPPFPAIELYLKPDNELDSESLRQKKGAIRIPQGLLSLGTMLHNRGYHVEIFDCRLHLDKGFEHFYRVLERKVKDTTLLVGISSITGQVAHTIKILESIKKVNPTVRTVLGGTHPTLFPRRTCEDKLVDFVIVGEGEYPMLELTSALEKSRPSYDKIKSLVYKENGHVKVNPLGEPFNIQELGTPAYHLLEMENYTTVAPLSPGLRKGLHYNSSRGCPFDCAFCINSIFPQYRRWRCKNPDQVIDDLRILKDKYKFDYVWLEEDNPHVNTKRASEIAKKLIEEKLDIEYWGEIAVRTIIRTPKEVLRLIKKSGWCETTVGVESGSDRILQYLRKGFTANQAIHAAKTLNELGVFAKYNFMYLLPNETRWDRKLTYKIRKKLKEVHPKSIIGSLTPYRPYPGSVLYNDCLKAGHKEPTTFREWPESIIKGSGEPIKMPWVKDYSLMELLPEYLSTLRERGPVKSLKESMTFFKKTIL